MRERDEEIFRASGWPLAAGFAVVWHVDLIRIANEPGLVGYRIERNRPMINGDLPFPFNATVADRDSHFPLP